MPQPTPPESVTPKPPTDWKYVIGTAAGAFLGRPVGLAAGAPADLLVLTASPLDDVRNTRSIAMVIRGGRPVDRLRPLGAPDLFEDLGCS